jgi:hypothetical protein
MRPNEELTSSRYLTGQIRAREESHRRAVLLGIAGLIVFSTSPVFGHHLSRQADAFLGGRDHLMRICLVALHLLLQPVHLAFHLLLVAGIGYAMWDRTRSSRHLRHLLNVLHWRSAEAGTRLDATIRDAGLGSHMVRWVEGLPNPAFTAGFWTPRVYVASELASMLSDDELQTVLAHEAAHVRRRDPLRLSALRFLACTLFYLPVLRRLADDAADEAEIAADDAALGEGKGRDPLVLASALVEIAQRWPKLLLDGAPTPLPIAGVAGRTGTDLLDRRVRRLLGGEAIVGTHLTRRSLAGAGAVLAMVWLSGLMMAHPLPADVAADAGFMGLELYRSAPQSHVGSHDSHCDHRGVFALTHLFCLGADGHKRGEPCPHAAKRTKLIAVQAQRA